ncbi:Salivary gland secretion 1 [Rhodotorula toruloides ATCC 204091]|uniref:Salivary gland secretion 1 n=1 Tax=Rhodotorula toruloides TaxID=5286 RepID=A0A0K3CF65_RHOTO|nr:Salivary gland secretion 1 [Rhodotorula toruloides ATCC 204091]PRQ73004.1 salivary gland secretion 1 [Rhodotorula toruloides]
MSFSGLGSSREGGCTFVYDARKGRYVLSGSSYIDYDESDALSDASPPSESAYDNDLVPGHPPQQLSPPASNPPGLSKPPYSPHVIAPDMSFKAYPWLHHLQEKVNDFKCLTSQRRRGGVVQNAKDWQDWRYGRLGERYMRTVNDAFKADAEMLSELGQKMRERYGDFERTNSYTFPGFSPDNSTTQLSTSRWDSKTEHDRLLREHRRLAHESAGKVIKKRCEGQHDRSRSNNWDPKRDDFHGFEYRGRYLSKHFAREIRRMKELLAEDA